MIHSLAMIKNWQEAGLVYNAQIELKGDEKKT